MAAGQRPSAAGYSASSHGRTAEPADHPGADVVEGRERIDEVPGWSDERADDRQPDPAVDPQEERRDGGLRGPAGDALGDDPEPADDAEDAQPDADAGPGGDGPDRQLRAVRADVANEHEHERQGDGRRGAGQVDSEGQPARVGRVEGVREHRSRQQQGEQPCRRADRRKPPGPAVAHAGGGVARPRRVSAESADDGHQGERDDDRQDHVVRVADRRAAITGWRRCHGRRRSDGQRRRGGWRLGRGRRGSRGRTRRRGRRRGRGGGHGEGPRPALQVAVVGRRGPLDVVVSGRQLGDRDDDQARRVGRVEAAAGQLGPGRVAQGQARTVDLEGLAERRGLIPVGDPWTVAASSGMVASSSAWARMPAGRASTRRAGAWRPAARGERDRVVVSASLRKMRPSGQEGVTKEAR